MSMSVTPCQLTGWQWGLIKVEDNFKANIFFFFGQNIAKFLGYFSQNRSHYFSRF